MRYLGIDFGLRHLGLAIAEGPLAEPLGEKNYIKEIELLTFLKKLIERQAIDIVVIGLPEGEIAKQVKVISQLLADKTGKKIILHDETLSTKEAKKKLIEAQAPQKKRRRIHQAAAALILQDYLDMMALRGKKNV